MKDFVIIIRDRDGEVQGRSHFHPSQEDSQDTTSIVIGRSSRCDVSVQNRRVSRKHCMLRCKDNVFFLKDLESKNGTYIDGEEIQESRLNPGQAFKIGGWSVRVRTDETISEMSEETLEGPDVAEQGAGPSSAKNQSDSNNISKNEVPDTRKDIERNEEPSSSSPSKQSNNQSKDQRQQEDLQAQVRSKRMANLGSDQDDEDSDPDADVDEETEERREKILEKRRERKKKQQYLLIGISVGIAVIGLALYFFL